MIKIIYVLLFFNLYSCADISSGDGSGGGILVGKEDLLIIDSANDPKVRDIDGDGTADAFDDNPQVSSYPRIVIAESIDTSMNWKINRDFGLVSENFSLDNRIGGDFREIRSSIIRSKLVSSVFDKIIDPNSDTITDNLIQVSDFDIFPISRWKPFDTLVARHLLRSEISELITSDIKTSFRVRLENIKDITEISQLKIELGFIDREDKSFAAFHTTRLTDDGNNLSIFKLDGTLKTLESQVIFKIRDQFASLNMVKEAISDERVLAVRIKDFEYVKKGKKLQYSEVLDNVNEKTARFLISDHKRTDLIHLVPARTILESFKQLRSSISVSPSRNIIGATHSRSYHPNTLFVNDIDLHKLNPDQLELGLWKTIPISTRIDEQAVKGNVYALVYGKAKNIVSSQKETSLFGLEQADSEAVVSSFGFGDEFVFETTIHKVEAYLTRVNGHARIEYEDCYDLGPPPSREPPDRTAERFVDNSADLKISFNKVRHCSMHGQTVGTHRDQIAYRTVPVELNELNEFVLNVKFGEKDLFLVENHTVYMQDGIHYIHAKIEADDVNYSNLVSFSTNSIRKTLPIGFSGFHSPSLAGLTKFRCLSGCDNSLKEFEEKILPSSKIVRFGNKHQ